MAKFNSKSSGTKTVNMAGGTAFSLDTQSELVSLVLCSFLSDKFYEKEIDQLTRLIKLVESVPHEFVSKLAIYARKVFHMRSITHVLVGELARLHKGDSLVADTLVAIAERPDDITEVFAYYGNKYGKPLPNSLKKGAARAIRGFNQYQLTKYKGNNKDVKLNDLFNLVHPKGTPEQMDMWGKLLKNLLPAPDTWEVLISGAKTKEEAKARWEQLITENKLGYMALLRNLCNFDKYDISREARQKACESLTDIERVRKSKQLPFRFFTAYKQAPTTQFKDAVSIALDIAVDNVPAFDGQTLVCIDTSGSMGSPLSGKGETRYIDIAALFGVALFKKNPHNTTVFSFDTEVRGHNFSSRTPVIDLISQVNNAGGSTELWKVFAALASPQNSKFPKFDRIVILSDMQAWDSSHWGNNSVNQYYENYKKVTGANPVIYSVDLSGYGTVQFPQKNIKFLAGWSEKIFDLMKASEKDSKALINDILNYGKVSTLGITHTDQDEQE